MSIYSIPLGTSFLPQLARGICDRYGQDPLTLSQIRIFLPTKRACMVLADYLAKLNPAGVSFTPKLIPLGEFTLSHIQDCLDPLALHGLKPISSLRRQFLLAHLILKWGELQKDFGPTCFDHALHLADSLASFFDQLQVEQIDLSALKTLVPQEFAHHWQATLSFLTLLIDQWPHILADENCVDAAVYRNMMFEYLLASFTDRPPQTPVIVAGSSGTFSMTARLMKVVSNLPAGSVVLSGLDQHTDDNLWHKTAESPTHPQHALMRLCRKHGWSRSAIKPWISEAEDPAMVNRRHYLSAAFAHQKDVQPAREIFANVSLIECQHLREEAQTIALILRDHWLHGDGDLAVITSDQMLIRYVESLLARWDMTIDNSAGTSLRRTQAGILFVQLLRVIESGWGNYELLMVLKQISGTKAEVCHPREGGDPVLRSNTCVSNSDDVGCSASQNWIPAFAGMTMFEKQLRSPDGLTMRLCDNPSLLELRQKFAPLEHLWAQGTATLHSLLQAHLNVYLALVEIPDDTLINHITDIIDNCRHLPAISVHHYAESVQVMLADAALRPPRQKGRAIYVWGSIEARLQKTSVVILAGLNEGTWPREIKPDPWINRAMRANLGLPPLERRIGLNAQDFCQAVCSAHVYLTRSQSIDGKIQLPSRFLHILRQGLSEDDLEPAKPYLAWARMMDKPANFASAAQPLPIPAMHLRPRQMSATHVEQLVKNPYGYYARFILGLKPLDPLTQEPSAAQFGTLIHSLLEQHKKTNIALELLGQEAFKVFANSPHILFFWWPRFLHIVQWITQQEELRAADLVASYMEIQGQIEIQTEAGPFTLRAKADRIDVMSGRRADIIDYKTGAIPTAYQMQNGEGAQLLLEALIAKKHGFALPSVPDQLAVSYWRLKGKKDAGEIKTYDDLDADIQKTEEGLRALLAYYENMQHGYAYGLSDPDYIARDAYRLLSRVDEWGSYAA